MASQAIHGKQVLLCQVVPLQGPQNCMTIQPYFTLAEVIDSNQTNHHIWNMGQGIAAR